MEISMLLYRRGSLQIGGALSVTVYLYAYGVTYTEPDGVFPSGLRCM